MIEAYTDAYKEFERGDVIFAGKNLMKLSFYIHNQYGPLDQFLWQPMVIFHKDIMHMQSMN